MTDGADDSATLRVRIDRDGCRMATDREEIATLRARVDELLAANGAEVARRRAAEASARVAAERLLAHQESVGDHAVTTRRLRIALTIARAWCFHEAPHLSSAAIDAIDDWIAGGMAGPPPWVDVPTFAPWAAAMGWEQVDGHVGVATRILEPVSS